MGGSRFNELQRGLSLISPTILSKRLESLSEQGLVLKKKISGQKGYEYFATENLSGLFFKRTSPYNFFQRKNIVLRH
jgi:DNA-binding HxlR family transcriptional regulator